MLWLIVAILSYLILAIVFLIDKYLLTGPILNPKVCTFYVGMLGILILVLAPFVGFHIPPTSQIFLSLLAGALFVYALFWFYKSLSLFEASRVVPAIGGLVPLFSIGLVFVLSFGKEKMSFLENIVFILLVVGSILIVSEKGKFINLKSLKISIISALFLSLSFVLSKYVYLSQPFWSGFIWTKVGGFLMGLCFFFFSKEVKEEILGGKITLKKKAMGIFIINQAAGGVANILQNFAIALAPLVYVAVINALQGVQYVFLLIFAVIFSLKYPKILKEEISKKIIFQKIIAIILIGTGLLTLALK